MYTVVYHEKSNLLVGDGVVFEFYTGVVKKGLSGKKFRCEFLTYKVGMLRRNEIKLKKQLAILIEKAFELYKGMDPSDSALIPPVAIIIANSSEDYITLHQARNELESKVNMELFDKILILSRSEILTEFPI